MTSAVINSKRIAVYLVPTIAWLLAKYGVTLDEDTQVQMSQMIDMGYSVVTGSLIIITKIMDNLRTAEGKPHFGFTDLLFFWRLFRK